MGCGCGQQPQGDMWEVVNADGTVSAATSKAEATAAAQAQSGSWIRQAGAVTSSK